MAGGRPRIYKTDEELSSAIEEYFEFIQGEYTWECSSDDNGKPIDVKVWKRKPEPPTITGLALFIGFESRQSIHDYEKNGEFSYTIKRARLAIENNYEKYLLSGDSPTGAIFALKNFGWTDRLATENKHEGELKIESVTVFKLPDNERD